MQVIESIAAMRAACSKARGEGGNAGRMIGLVPTMGALHAGHLSLVARAQQHHTTTAVSIFVNPLQFGPKEDLDRYPRQLARDLDLLREAGVDLVFTPTAAAMYPQGGSMTVEVGALGERLDGAHRPGHFRGVATVVAKLFHIVQPAYAFFGQKDAVQVAVLRRMVRDLNFDLDLVVCPIVRDADGLALSSRNVYLTAAERRQALALPHALGAIERMLDSGVQDAAAALAAGREVVAAEPAVQLEYLEAVDAQTLLPVPRIAPGTLVAIAARVGATRLIDNLLTP